MVARRKLGLTEKVAASVPPLTSRHHHHHHLSPPPPPSPPTVSAIHATTAWSAVNPHLPSYDHCQPSFWCLNTTRLAAFRSATSRSIHITYLGFQILECAITVGLGSQFNVSRKIESWHFPFLHCSPTKICAVVEDNGGSWWVPEGGGGRRHMGWGDRHKIKGTKVITFYSLNIILISFTWWQTHQTPCKNPPCRHLYDFLYSVRSSGR